MTQFQHAAKLSCLSGGQLRRLLCSSAYVMSSQRIAREVLRCRSSIAHPPPVVAIAPGPARFAA